MIYDKSLSLPEFNQRCVRIDGKEIAGRGALRIRRTNLKAKGDSLESAEGAKPVFSLPAGTERIYRAAWDGRFYAYASGSLYVREEGAFVRRSGCTVPSDIVGFISREGTAQTYAVCRDETYKINYNGTETVSALGGGDCAALYNERLFSAKGDRVAYTQALTPQSAGVGVQGRGYIDLPHENGNILRMTGLENKLFLFRERGISYLRVLGDNLNFNAGSVTCSFGRLNARSVAKCGGKIAFLSESGFFLFDGTVCERISVSDDIDFTVSAEGAGQGGKYYAAVTLKSGERALFAYDFFEKSSYLLNYRAQSVVFAEQMYFSVGNNLYTLTECGLPQGERATVETELTLLGLSDGNKYLDAVVIEGTGYFSVEVRSDTGGCGQAQGEAGRRLALRYPVKGNAFAFRIHSYSQRVEIGGITLYVRQEKKYGY